MRLRFLTSIAVSLSSAIVLAQSAAPPPSQEQRPTFRTEANYVRVDVYPSKDGQPISNLTASDFEVLEDGRPQTIAAFEHVVIRPAGPESGRIEPNTIDQARDMARNPRARVIILFLDVPHVTVHGTWTIREPLIRLLGEILGADDLVGVMTPGMAPTDVVLARRTDVLTGGLRDRWPWGERGTIETNDREKLYAECYAQLAPDVVEEMTARRRERATLEALDELARFLRDLRDERKAILTVTEGWLLYRPNQDLMRLRTDPVTGAQEPIPGVDPITVGPDGRLTTKNTRRSTGFERTACDADRLRLTNIDDFQLMRDLIDDANRGNVTFYTVDPRGLAVFDTPAGPAAPPSLAADYRMLQTRQDNMRVLATNTDGVAVMSSNDLDRGMQRIADDLTSYYLLGYYSTNSQPDGKFHAITVRVTQPGVDVRARRGYRSATAEEVARARTAAAAPVPENVSAVTSAIGTLSRIRPDARLHINAVPRAAAGSSGIAHVWVAVELTFTSTEASAAGTVADVEVSGGGVVGTAHVELAPLQRGFLTDVSLPAPLDGTTVDVRVRVSGPGVARTTDSVTAELTAGLPRPLVFRRGPSSGNRQQPAASFLFSRTERMHLEVPIDAGWTPGPARLLDKTGQPIAVPVATGERTDAGSGQRG